MNSTAEPDPYTARALRRPLRVRGGRHSGCLPMKASMPGTVKAMTP